MCAFFNEIHPVRVAKIIFDDEIPCGDEIRLDGGRVDFISSDLEFYGIIIERGDKYGRKQTCGYVNRICGQEFEFD